LVEYEEFLIGDLKTGLFIGKEPWLAPPDAFPTLENVCVDKGVLRRRRGSEIIIPTGLASLPVTGINAIAYSGYIEVIACTTRQVWHIHAAS